MVLLAPVQADQLEQFFSAMLPATVPRGIEQWQFDIFERGGSRQQVEALKNESDSPAPDRRELFFGESGHVLPFEQVAPARGPIQASDDIHQGRFAGARRAHDRNKLAALNRERHSAQRVHLDLTQHVGFPEINQFDDWHRHCSQTES